MHFDFRRTFRLPLSPRSSICRGCQNESDLRSITFLVQLTTTFRLDLNEDGRAKAVTCEAGKMVP